MSVDDAPAAESDGVDDLPREPSAYHPSVHFAERFEDRYDDGPSRHLDGEIVRGCIEEGEVTHRQRDAAHLRRTFGGVTYRLVVNPETRAVVTGYPLAINTEAARASGRWSSAQIGEIREFLASK